MKARSCARCGMVQRRKRKVGKRESEFMQNGREWDIKATNRLKSTFRSPAGSEAEPKRYLISKDGEFTTCPPCLRQQNEDKVQTECGNRNSSNNTK